MTAKAIPKFRPYLSIEAMGRIMSLIKNPGDSIDKEIAKSFVPIIAKYKADVEIPAYIATPKPSLQDKLGISDDELDAGFQNLLGQIAPKVVDTAPDTIVGDFRDSEHPHNTGEN